MGVVYGSSKVMVNGRAGDLIAHRRGLQQGDPLPPFLFILAMEPLQRILALAVEDGHLSALRGRILGVRASLYADDVALFLNPIKHEVATIRGILTAFGTACQLRQKRCYANPM